MTGDHHETAFVSSIAEKRGNAVGRVGVEARERFVDEEDGGIRRKRAGECDATLGPGRKGTALDAGDGSESELIEQGQDARGIGPGQSGGQREILLRRQVPEQVSGMSDVCNRRPYPSL